MAHHDRIAPGDQIKPRLLFFGGSFVAGVRALIRERGEPRAAVRVAADFPAARLSARDLKRVLGKKKTG